LGQRHWLEFLKQYDLQIQYHQRKPNVVADAVSRKAQLILNAVVITQWNLLNELEDLGVQLVSHGQASVQLLVVTLQPFIMKEIRADLEMTLNSKG